MLVDGVPGLREFQLGSCLLVVMYEFTCDESESMVGWMLSFSKRLLLFRYLGDFSSFWVTDRHRCK